MKKILRFPAPPGGGDAIERRPGEAADSSPETCKTDYSITLLLHDHWIYKYRSMKTYICSICKIRDVVLRGLLIILWCNRNFPSSIIHVPTQHALWILLLVTLVFREMDIINNTIVLSITINCRTPCLKVSDSSSRNQIVIAIHNSKLSFEIIKNYV